MPITHPTGIIRHNVLIPLSSPEVVYRAFLSSKGYTQFTDSEAKCSARVGGRFTAWSKYISGKIIKLVKDKVPASQVDQYDKGWYESYWEPLKQYFRAKAQSK